jgi:hypothetical protein
MTSATDFLLLSGEPAIYVKAGDSGALRAQAFCNRCGSPLYTYAVADPTILGLRTGCIEERHQLIPREQKWCSSALAWSSDLRGMPRSEGD